MARTSSATSTKKAWPDWTASATETQAPDRLSAWSRRALPPGLLTALAMASMIVATGACVAHVGQRLAGAGGTEFSRRHRPAPNRHPVRTPRAPRRVGPFSFSTRATSEAVRSGLPIIHSLACLWALDVFDLPRREDHRALARGSQVEPCVISCDSTPANGVNFSARVSAEYVCVV